MNFRDILTKTANKVDPAKVRVNKLKSLLRVQADQGDYAYKMERSVLKSFLECDADYVENTIIPLVQQEGVTVEKVNSTYFLFSWKPR